MRGLTPAGQRPLIVRGLGDTPGPPRRRCGGQVPLAPGPRVVGVLEAIRAPGFEVTGGQRTQMGTDQPQHPLVLGGEALEPVAYRHTRRAGRDERRVDAAELLVRLVLTPRQPPPHTP